MENLSILATLVVASGTLSLLFLLLLHFKSPEFQPGWRMVSEYALGKHKGLLTAFFFCWGISSILVSLLFWFTVTGTWAKIGTVFIFISGIGAIMGGLFDVNHKHHGLSFALGVPTPIIGSLLIAYHLIHLNGWQLHNTKILLATHAIWISCVLMGASMALMFSGFKKAGIRWDKDSAPPTEVPRGVIALGGYANRILVLCYIGWNIVTAYIYLSLH